MVILTRVTKTQTAQPSGQPQISYSCDFQHVFAVLSNDKDNPDSSIHTPQQIQNAIIQDDLRFNTEEQEWNEYIADDGARIRIQPTVLRVAKTSLRDNRGYPIYSVSINATLDISDHHHELELISIPYDPTFDSNLNFSNDPKT